MNYDFSVIVWGKNKLGNKNRDKVFGIHRQLCRYVNFFFHRIYNQESILLSFQEYFTLSGSSVDVTEMN